MTASQSSVTAGTAGTLTGASIRIDVSEVLPGGWSAEVAVTVYASADACAAGRRPVLAFGYPGGGYSRAYFALRHPTLSGPGQAEYHASRGWVFVACDPLGGGDGTPLDDSVVTLDTSARAADLVTRVVRERLLAGTLRDHLGPTSVAAMIGIGHSLGGMQLIHQQSALRTFDAVAVLGFSARHTLIPTPADDMLAPAAAPAASPSTLADAWSGPLSDDIAHLRYAYHWDDVPSELVAADMSAGFPVRTADPLPSWITATFPPFAAVCMSPGIVSAQAAAIDVPVFVGAGQRDVLADLRAEVAAYSGSRHITLSEVSRCAHMHNFSPQRRLLWEWLHVWGESAPVITSCR